MNTIGIHESHWINEFKNGEKILWDFCCYWSSKIIPTYRYRQNNGVGKSQLGNHHSKIKSIKNTKGCKN